MFVAVDAMAVVDATKEKGVDAMPRAVDAMAVEELLVMLVNVIEAVHLLSEEESAMQPVGLVSLLVAVVAVVEPVVVMTGAAVAADAADAAVAAVAAAAAPAEVAAAAAAARTAKEDLQAELLQF